MLGNQTSYISDRGMLLRLNFHFWLHVASSRFCVKEILSSTSLCLLLLLNARNFPIFKSGLFQCPYRRQYLNKTPFFRPVLIHLFSLPQVINAIASAISGTAGCSLLDVDPGASTNRTVYTFVGSPEAVVQGALNAARQAFGLIDMSKHSGQRPPCEKQVVLKDKTGRGIPDKACVLPVFR